MLSNLPPLRDDEEDVIYDAESLFTNISISVSIEYIKEYIIVFLTLIELCVHGI